MTTPRTDPVSPASAFATALLGEFARAGVTDIVVCPGSRSQALALAAARFERAGLLRLHVRIDERAAGFLALGLARESERPVAVVTTSGTAVANLLPAALEAAHSGIPLVLLTADRPDELRGVGANQTTRQPGMFDVATSRGWDVPAPSAGDPVETGAAELVAEALRDIAGPVHLNLAFREPLSGAAPLPDIDPGSWAPAPASADPVVLRAAPGTVVVAGTGAGEQAEEAARALGAPLLAEVTSGARFGPNLVAAYRELLDTANFGDRIERVIVFGHPTLSREIPALIERPGVETIVVRSPGVEDYNPGRAVARHLDTVRVVDDPAAVESARSWVGRWVHASRQLVAVPEQRGAVLTEDLAERAQFARDQLAHLRAPVTRRMLVDAVWNASWPHDRLVLAASRLIRELDRVAPGKKLRVHANRGLAGIDGTIATATGIALAAEAEGAEGITRLLLGDLALQHDLGSLLAAAGEAEPRLQVIVGNDGGGSIFDLLEVAAQAEPELIDRVLYTPHTMDIEALATAAGWEYRRVDPRADLDGALTPAPGRTLVEVALAR